MLKTTLMEDYGITEAIVTEAGQLPESAPAIRTVVQNASARLTAIADDASLFPEARQEQANKLLDDVTGRLSKISEDHDALLATRQEAYLAEITRFEVPPGADAIREPWFGLLGDPLQAEMLYSQADDATRAAIATAHPRPVKDPRTDMYTLVSIVSQDYIRRDALARNPEVQGRVNTIENHRSQNRFLAAVAGKMLAERVGGGAWQRR